MSTLIRHSIYRLLLSLALLLPVVSGVAFWINVEVPPSGGQNDIAVTWPTRVTWGESEIYDFIGVVNQYLWFTIIIIIFAALLYAGFKMMTSVGKADWFTTLINVLKGAGLWIMLSILSYVIVRLVINLL